MATKAKDLPPGVPPEGGAPAAPEGLKPPPFGTPKKLTEADVAGDLPRVVPQLARVPGGSKAKRYKTRVINHDGFRKPLYILALDKDSAKACHVKAVGLAGYLQSLRDAGAKEADIAEPQVLATELPD